MQVETPAVDTLGNSMSRSESDKAVSVRGKSLEGLFDRVESGGDGEFTIIYSKHNPNIYLLLQGMMSECSAFLVL